MGQPARWYAASFLEWGALNASHPSSGLRALPDDSPWRTDAFPSLTEGFGRVTLEAMACGVPVITTENARGIVEDGKSGFVVPIRDARALGEKIEYLYSNRDAASRMGGEARASVERKEPFGKAVFRVYEEAMRREEKDREAVAMALAR